MNGLETIKNKILDDAKANAKQTIEKAEKEANAVLQDYQNTAETIKNDGLLSATQEKENLINRASSMRVMEKGRAVLLAKTEQIEAVYTKAGEELKNLPTKERLDFLLYLLKEVLLSYLAELAQSRLLYGHEGMIEPEAYEVILNAQDNEAFKATFLDAFIKAYGSFFEKNILEKLLVAEDIGRFSGGLVLRLGAVESNATLDMLVSQHREKQAGEVYRILFQD